MRKLLLFALCLCFAGGIVFLGCGGKSSEDAPVKPEDGEQATIETNPPDVEQPGGEEAPPEAPE